MDDKINMSNLRKSIFYLQMALRYDYQNDETLLEALNLITDVIKKNSSELNENFVAKNSKT